MTGSLVRCVNRRLRAALMNIADNLTKCNQFFIGQSLLWQKSDVDPRAIRVRVAKHFTRLCFALVAGRQELRHECLTGCDSLLRKLRKFHQEHHSTSDQMRSQLEAAAELLTQPARTRRGIVECRAVWFRQPPRPQFAGRSVALDLAEIQRADHSPLVRRTVIDVIPDGPFTVRALRHVGGERLFNPCCCSRSRF